MVLYSLGKHNACKCTVSVEGAHLVPGLGFDPAHSGRRSAPSPLHQPCTTLAPQCHKELYAGLDFQGKTSGQLAPKFSDLAASKSVSISEKQGLLVTSEKNCGCIGNPSGRNVELWYVLKVCTRMYWKIIMPQTLMVG